MILFTSNPGAKCWHVFRNVRYCVGMKSLHPQPAGNIGTLDEIRLTIECATSELRKGNFELALSELSKANQMLRCYSEIAISDQSVKNSVITK